VIDPFEVMDRFGTDTLRYYLFREVNFGQDGSISAAGFETRYNAELANEYGNLASRTLAMIVRYRDGNVPQAATDAVLAADFDGLDAEVAALLDGAELSQALDAIWQRVRRCNRYVEERAPWVLAKDPAQADVLDETLASLAEAVRALSVLLHPYMPSSTATLLDALGRPAVDFAAARYAPHGWGGAVGPLAPLFPKVAER
jgi:methionyl-tRNA synthetase